MELKDILSTDDKLRIIQELVPGKQITLAHVIASPDPILYTKLGLNPEIDFGRSAIGTYNESCGNGDYSGRLGYKNIKC